MLSQYTTKCKCILKMTQIIAKLDEVLIIIYWIWIKIVPFQLQLKSLTYVISQKNLETFFIQTSKSVLKKNILLKNYFLLKDDKNYVGGLCIKIHFICLSKC